MLLWNSKQSFTPEMRLLGPDFIGPKPCKVCLSVRTHKDRFEGINHGGVSRNTT